MKCYIIPVTAFQQNCSILICEDSNKAAVVDPGGDVQEIIGALKKVEAEAEKIFLTHGHMDHVGGVEELSRELGLPIEGPHEGDRGMIERLGEPGIRHGTSVVKSFEPDRWLVDGDRVQFGEQELEVRHCPGHTPGHIIFYHEGDKIALVGDVLFQGSIGRTDLPGGDHNQLIRSITENLWPLGEDVTFVPGHGPLSTIGQERQTNPFVADMVLSSDR